MPERPVQPDPKRPTLDELIDRDPPVAPDDLARLAGGDAKAHLQVQARIDESLRRMFADETAGGAFTRASSRSAFTRWIPWAAAAVVLLAGLAAWRVWTVSHRPDVLGPLYKTTVASGFVPEVVCTTDDEFANWCRAYLRQPLYVTSRPDGIQYVGWNKGRVISPISGVLLVRVDRDPVVVVLERSDRQTVVPGKVADTSLHRFERRIGDVILYEVTPRDHASILPVLAEKPSR